MDLKCFFLYTKTADDDGDDDDDFDDEYDDDDDDDDDLLWIVIPIPQTSVSTDVRHGTVTLFRASHICFDHHENDYDNYDDDGDSDQNDNSTDFQH